MPGMSVISPKKLAHVVLRTRAENFKPMVNFYKTFLGGHASYENDFLSFITYDDEHHRIAIAAIPGLAANDPKTSGLEHIAFTFDSLDELLQSYRQRKAIGIEPLWAVNHGVTMSIYYRDPDGNRLETQVDIFDTSEEASAYMLGPDYAENPIGVDFDPEELIAKLAAGESAQKLTIRPNIGLRDLSTIPLLAA